MYLNLIKAVYITKHILNDEKLKTFLLRSETKQGCPLTTFFNIVLEAQALEAQARAIRKENKIEGIQIGKEKVKASYLSDIRLHQNTVRTNT